MARQFISEGHDVKIYTFSLQYPDFLFPGKTQYSESAPPTDLTIISCINSVNPYNWWVSGKKIKREQADIVIVRYWLPFMGPCLGTVCRVLKSTKTQIIGLIDNAIPHEKRPGDHWFTQYFVSALDGFVTMSSYVKSDLKQFTQKEVKLISHPLYDNFGAKLDKNEARHRLNISFDGMIFLFFGFIRQYKGLDILIQAIELLPDHQDFRLLIAGEYYAGEDQIKSQLQQSPKAGKILEHTHFIKDEDVGLYFSASDVVVQPYRNATQSGVTPLAYHFEVPMIVTNVGALPDLVPPTLGLVCEPNPESLAHAMEQMVGFDQVTFASEIKTEKQMLSWETLTHAILEIAQQKA
jgi:glycosyltransferase involved in cell wall biosynthesis